MILLLSGHGPPVVGTGLTLAGVCVGCLSVCLSPPAEGVLDLAEPGHRGRGRLRCLLAGAQGVVDLAELGGRHRACPLGQVFPVQGGQPGARGKARPRWPGSARSRTPSAGGLRQTDKQRTRTPAKVNLVRTTGGLWPLSNKITIYGWSTKQDYDVGAVQHEAPTESLARWGYTKARDQASCTPRAPTNGESRSQTRTNGQLWISDADAHWQLYAGQWLGQVLR